MLTPIAMAPARTPRRSADQTTIRTTARPTTIRMTATDRATTAARRQQRQPGGLTGGGKCTASVWVLRSVTARRALHAEAAKYFLRDGVRDIRGLVGIGVEPHDVQRVCAVRLPGRRWCSQDQLDQGRSLRTLRPTCHSEGHSRIRNTHCTARDYTGHKGFGIGIYCRAGIDEDLT